MEPTNDFIQGQIDYHKQQIADLEAKLSPPKTLIAILVDESGSMMPVRDKTLSGLNEYLQDRRKDAPDAHIIVNTFNTTNRVRVNQPLSKTKDFESNEYLPAGGTALYQSVLDTLNLVDKQTFDRVLFLIITDGEDNASGVLAQTACKQEISKREELGNHTFVFMGANQDAWTAAQSMGMRHKGSTYSYNASAPGAAFASASLGTSNMVRSANLFSCNFNGTGSTLDLNQEKEEDNP